MIDVNLMCPDFLLIFLIRSKRMFHLPGMREAGWRSSASSWDNEAWLLTESPCAAEKTKGASTSFQHGKTSCVSLAANHLHEQPGNEGGIVNCYHSSVRSPCIAWKQKKGTEMPGVREGGKGAQGVMEEGEKVCVDQRDKNNDVDINWDCWLRAKPELIRKQNWEVEKSR